MAGYAYDEGASPEARQDAAREHNMEHDLEVLEAVMQI